MECPKLTEEEIKEVYSVLETQLLKTSNEEKALLHKVCMEFKIEKDKILKENGRLIKKIDKLERINQKLHEKIDYLEDSEYCTDSD